VPACRAAAQEALPACTGIRYAGAQGDQGMRAIRRGAAPRLLPLMAALLMLAACGTTARGPRGVPGYESGARATSCVPYARARSGIDLAGDAWQWWEAASGRYDRSRTPRRGSVLVIARTSRLPQGHLAVVSRVVSDREIRVDHANWAPGGSATRGRVAREQPVIDVSPGGDWSVVRVWYPPVNGYGQTGYPAYGFVHPTARMAAAGA
jgi:surface antigen